VECRLLRQKQPPRWHFKAGRSSGQSAGERPSLIAEQFALSRPVGIAAQFRLMKSSFREGSDDGGGVQPVSLPVPVSPESGPLHGRSHNFDLPHHSLQRRAAADNFPQSPAYFRGLLFDGLPADRRSLRSVTKVIQRKGDNLRTAVVTSTGTLVPSLRSNSFSKGVQAPKRSPSSMGQARQGGRNP